jgi:DNA-binding transcriptional regulator YiaG
MTLCAQCDSDLGYEADSGVSVTCSRCVQAKCLRLESGDEAQRATLEPDTVKRLRKAHGWTQADLALKLRLSVQQVSEFERGLRLPDKALFEWAEAKK